MAVHRREAYNIDAAWFELKQTGQQTAEIPLVCVTYTADKNDTHADIKSSTGFVLYGDELQQNGQGTGLYCAEWTLVKICDDSTTSTWEQRIKVSTSQPEKIGADPNPLNRGVEALERSNERRKVPTLVDYFNQPVRNRAGDFMSGFEAEVPTAIYRFVANFSTIPSWVFDLYGCVNSVRKTLPLYYRNTQGGLTLVQNVILYPGTAKLVVTRCPLKPIVENNVQFFPIEWQYEVSNMGWAESLLNQGFAELVYLNAQGNEVDLAEIKAGNYAKIEKRRILDDDGEPVKDEVFLDWFGRKLPTNSATLQASATVSTIEGNTQINGTLSDDWIGRYVVVQKPSSPLRWATTIKTYNAGVATTTTPAPWTVSGASMYYSGINAMAFAPVPYADLSSVPV